eukprot:Gb_11098 [translate_table: standard]
MGMMNALTLLLLAFAFLQIHNVVAQLSVDYYRQTCPQVENIIRAEMIRKQAANPTTAAGTLRIFFHDCFVEGCDASVLIRSTPNNKAERDAEINLSLPGDGFDAITRAKTAVEAKCPGIVSCADIISITTRDLILLTALKALDLCFSDLHEFVLARVQIGGPYYPVKKGRKDGRISQASRVAGNLPLPTMTVDRLSALFRSKGLTQADMITLSGAHTVGFAHCKEFMNRIYNYNRTFPIDPTMNFQYAKGLQQACPRVNLDPTIVAFNDVNSPRKFDNGFYRNLPNGLGLLASDQILYTDLRSRGLVQAYATNQAAFFNAFVAAMDKLSTVGVKTGRQGDVRKRCDAFN